MELTYRQNGDYLIPNLEIDKQPTELIGKIRENAQSVSQRALQGNLQRTAADGRTGRTSSGDGQIGEDAGRTDRGAHGESRGRDGGAESPRSDEMGGADEQSAAHRRGGDHSPRGDLQLTPRAFPTEKETAFPS